MSSSIVEPSWLKFARTQIGVREIVGPRHSPTIMGWIKRLGSKVLGVAPKDDETPWCGTFMAEVMTECGITPPKIAIRASSWMSFGVWLLTPTSGAVLVFQRPGGGHVGLYVGEDSANYHVLGGNQGNAVSITRIAKARCTAIRWPAGVPLPSTGRVLLSSGAPVSRNEA